MKSCGPDGGANCIVRYECQERLEAAAEIRRLRVQIAGHEAFERSVVEALNSGDGSYRP